MNGKCFEIGTLQAFLDGETTPDVSLRLTGHVSDCDRCARALADAEEENSLVFSTLGRELDTLVPTQRLWSRINETLETEKSRVPVWQKVFALVSASFANPSIAVAASVLLVLGMFGIFVLRSGEGELTARQFESPVPQAEVPAGGIAEVNTTTTDIQPPAPTTAAPKVGESRLSSSEMRALAASARSTQNEIRPQRADLRVTTAPGGYLPGEESYIKTIADLKQNVDSQKDTVLTPSTRVSYERDMAVVNDSIKRMRDVVRKNPRNQAARQVLYASYQDKIDLLNSVAQREELMASLR